MFRFPENKFRKNKANKMERIFFRTLLITTVSYVLVSYALKDVKITITTDNKQKNTEQTHKIDTIYVLGTFDGNIRTKMYKSVYGVNNAGQEYVNNFVLSPNDSLTAKAITFVQRGDTIVVQGDKAIKNITLENLADKLIKTR